ncbi:MAG: FHA domain-containing protein [Nannocystaceae bacterium]|nr:FHA domain-containing protein [Nannocystaceae bacterium]
MRRQLRAIEGALTGAVFVVRGRTRIGRASDSDIQILHDGVSRQHAQVIEDNAGNAVLMDLASNNGTFVGERRVVRHRLVPGDEIRIMRARFVFEQVEDEAPDPDAGVFAVKSNAIETHRRTVDHWSLDLPAPRERTPSSGSLVVEPGADRHRVVACLPDGSNYSGDIIGDILDYRALRLRSLRGDPMSEADVRRFGALQGALHQPPGDPDPAAAGRRFCRFRCGFPARLRYGDHFGDRTARVTVYDLGAGGAAVTAQIPDLAVGNLAWLVIDLVVGKRPRTIVFTSRVVSSDGGRLGLLFAGAPEWDQWRAR